MFVLKRWRRTRARTVRTRFQRPLRPRRSTSTLIEPAGRAVPLTAIRPPARTRRACVRACTTGTTETTTEGETAPAIRARTRPVRIQR